MSHKKKTKENPDLCLRSCQEQGDVGAVLPGQDGHGFLSVLDVESIDLEKWKWKMSKWFSLSLIVEPKD